jgi:hypothetical protein
LRLRTPPRATFYRALLQQVTREIVHRLKHQAKLVLKPGLSFDQVRRQLAPELILGHLRSLKETNRPIENLLRTLKELTHQGTLTIPGEL